MLTTIDIGSAPTNYPEGDAMKTLSRLLLIAIFTLSLALLNACGKDTVSPYIPSDTSGVTDAKDIEYSSSCSSYSENGPREESLDSAGGGAQAGSYGTGADQNSDEYKKMN